jgi:hypothetical protein
MSVTWGASSRLTLKRQRIRREKGRPHVSSLGLIIREIQRDAAARPTDQLRTDIEISLEVLDAAIGQFYSVPPGIRHMDEWITATSEVMVAVLTTALYVRELATRPAAVVVIGGSLN